MAKEKQAKSIRDVELHQDAQKALDAVFESAKKLKVSSKNDIMEQFYDCFESGDNFADQLNKRGIDNRRAQLYAVTFVQNNLGRKVTKPKYGALFVPINLRDTVDLDEKSGKRTRTISSFGQCILINLKNNEEFDEKFAVIKAYDNECSKIENLEIGSTFHLEATGGSVSGDVVNLTVDDRCITAKTSERILSDVEELMTKLFDITPISEASEKPSEGKYGDYRLVEGLINFITFPRNKNYAKMELTDISVSLEELEKKKNQANLTCLINADMVTGIGRESIVRFLGRISVKDDPEWGLQTTLFFPVMAYPMLINAPKEIEAAPSEEVADASNYFSKDVAPVDNGEYDEFFEGDKDEEVNSTEENTGSEEIESEPEQEAAEAEPETEEPEEEVAETSSEDPYESVKDHECWKSGDFGKPEGVVKGEKGFNNGCYQCSKNSPEVYELCVQKSKE